MTQRFEPLEWQNRVVDTDGTVLQPGTPLSAENLNRLEQMVAFLANAIGVVDGIAPLNAQGIVPPHHLPAKLREVRVVANIAARDALEPFEGLHVLVTDATADETVNGGWAEYIHDGSVFVKVGEGESLDVTLTWDAIANKPTTFIPITHEHTESEIKDLDKYTKKQVDDKLAQKAGTALATTQQDGLMSATSFTELTLAVQKLVTVMQHVENKENPHGVTKKQVGLEHVENYAIANQLQAETATANNLYMTPLRVAQAIAQLVPTGLSGFTNDIAAPNSEAPRIYVRPSNQAPSSPPLKSLWIVT